MAHTVSKISKMAFLASLREARRSFSCKPFVFHPMNCVVDLVGKIEETGSEFFCLVHYFLRNNVHTFRLLFFRPI